MTERIFDGLKVIDCASFIAGPAAATVMSDFGAEVIKIEPPGAGDAYRRRAVPVPGRPLNPGFMLDGRNKKSLALDLRNAAGRAVLHRLVKDADVFITNYPPPVRRRLGITYEELAPLNERLIYASFTGYGETGPEADKPGFDATAWWARTGLMHLVRAGDEVAPARSLPGMGDHPSAMGTYGALCGDTVVPQPPREAAVNALRVHYRCRDGRWLLLSIAADEWRWDKLKACLGDDILDEPRFATVDSREANARELVAILDGIFATRDLAEWRRMLDEAGLIFGIVAEPEDIAQDEQVLAAGHLVNFVDSDLMTINSPIEIRGQVKVAPRPAPKVGEHSEAVLREAGYSEAEVAALRADGVIG